MEATDRLHVRSMALMGPYSRYGRRVLGFLLLLFAWCSAAPAHATSGTISSPVAGPLTVNAGETLEIVGGGSVTDGDSPVIIGNTAYFLTAVTVNAGGTLNLSGGSVSAGNKSNGVTAQGG